MGDDDDGSSRRTSPLDRSPRSPASRLGNARIANALACAPVTTESRDASARSGPADDARETEETNRSPAHRMSVYIGTWNVGNTAPRMDAAKAWLAPARGHAIVAVAAQEASYPHSKHNLSPKDVTAELSERKGDSTANPEVGGSTPPSRGTEGKSRGVGWRMTRSKMTRFSGAVAGALAGAVAAGPLAPIGAVAGAAAGYYSSAKVAEELKVRDHWFDLVKAAVGPEYVTVQTAVLLQMRLIVLARRDVADLVTETRVGYQATGILGGTVGNKGGLMVRIELAHGRESMAFVATHLSAHEGEKHVRSRNESLARILAGCWDGSLVRRLGEGGNGVDVDGGSSRPSAGRDGDDAGDVRGGGGGRGGREREETRFEYGEDGTGGGTGGVGAAGTGDADADADVEGSIPTRSAGPETFGGGRSPTTRSMTARSALPGEETPNNASSASSAETPIRIARQLSRKAGDFLQEAGATVTASPAMRRAREGIEKLQSASGKVLAPGKALNSRAGDATTGVVSGSGDDKKLPPSRVFAKEPARELLACTGHVFVFGDLNYRIDPGAVVHREWGAMWKRSNDAPSGSIAAAVAGLAAKSAKKKAVASAFQATSPSGKGGAGTAGDGEDGGSIPGSSANPGSSAAGSSAATPSGAATPVRGGPGADDRHADRHNDAFNSAAWVEGWRAVAGLCDASDWASLRAGDQLSREIRRGVVLHGFREGALAFRPTFKLDSSTERKGDAKANPEVGGSTPPSREDQSDVSTHRGFSRKRVPSWCDRVTFGSLPGFQNGFQNGSDRVRVEAYGACHGLTTSDHAPVYASLDVAIRGVEDATCGDDSGWGGGSGGWEGRLRTTPERVRRARSTGATTTTRLRAAAPPAAATVAVNSLRVVARGFQNGFQKGGGGGSKGGTTADLSSGDSSARLDKAKSSDKTDNQGDGGEPDSSAAGSDVDAAAAALRRLLASVTSVPTSTSTSSPPPLPVTVHVSCEGGVEVVAPEAPADRAAGASVVRVVGEPRGRGLDSPRQLSDDEYDDDEYDDEDDEEDGSTKKTRLGAKLEISWADGATPSIALAPRCATVDTNRQPRGSPPRRARLGTRRSTRGSKSEPVGSGKESVEASAEGLEPGGARTSLDETAEDALASRIEALTMSPSPSPGGADFSSPQTWSRVSRVNALGACHAIVTISVDGCVAGVGVVGLGEAVKIVADGIRAGDVRDDQVASSGAVRFSVPLTRCGRLFGRVEGTVSIAVPAA